MAWTKKVGVTDDGIDLLEGMDTDQRVAMDKVMKKHVAAVNALHSGLNCGMICIDEMKLLLLNIGYAFGAMADVSPNVFETEAYMMAIDQEVIIGETLYEYGLDYLI